MGWRIDDDESRALCYGLFDLVLNARRRTVDHFRRSIISPRTPLASGRLRIGIDNEGNLTNCLGSSGEVHRQRGFS